jgi:hypothetical protein
VLEMIEHGVEAETKPDAHAGMLPVALDTA